MGFLFGKKKDASVQPATTPQVTSSAPAAQGPTASQAPKPEPKPAPEPEPKTAPSQGQHKPEQGQRAQNSPRQNSPQQGQKPSQPPKNQSPKNPPSKNQQSKPPQPQSKKTGGKGRNGPGEAYLYTSPDGSKILTWCKAEAKMFAKDEDWCEVVASYRDGRPVRLLSFEECRKWTGSLTIK